MKINTLILGKSGVGKSSLLNYLWGDAIAKVGTGRPVTPRSNGRFVGLYEHRPVNIEEHQLIIFDSWGLEADQATEWTKTITDEISKREDKPNLEAWFHAVIYCVSAAGARIEPFEIEKVLVPLAKQGQAITFALTKTDIASKEEIFAIKKAINDAYPNNGGIVEICSEGKKLRNGTTTHPYGKEDLFITLTKNLAIKLRTKLASKYIDKCKEQADQWKEFSLSLYDMESSILRSTGKTLEIISEPIQSTLEAKLRNTNEWMQDSINKVESLEGAFRKITKTSEKYNVRASDVFSPEKIQWTFLDHVTAYAKYLIPFFGAYHVFAANSTYRKELSEKLDETILEVMRAAKKTVSAQLLAFDLSTKRPSERKPIIKTSTNTRPDSTIQIMQAINRNNPD